MDDTSVCFPQLAEPNAQNNTTSSPNAASVTDADKVINTKIDSAQVEGDQNDEQLLRGLLADDYCHVCEAVLLFESQRLSHYEGKKHAQKLKVYLQAKRAERTHAESPGPQRITAADRDRFCELCNMVFSSHLVAKSHYEGKVHTKNLRKQQGLQPPAIDRYTEACALPRPTRDPDNADQRSAPESGGEHADPAAEPDLRDPNRHCALCAASFNNPQMALQHYNGRKHQRNQARRELIRELGDDVQQANSLMCQMCGVQFNSVEMYQAHMQGNKHQIREKKVIDLCKSQQKVYNTFADELADYIQVQKARGITPKAGQAPPQGDAQGDEEGAREALHKEHVTELNTPAPDPPRHARPGSYFPAEGWRPPYPGPPWPPHGWNYNCPLPVPPGAGTPQLPGWPMKRRRRRKQSSSSSYSTSSSYSSSSSSSSSSDSSSTSDGGDSGSRRRERRRVKRSRRERGRRPRGEESDKEERRRKRPRRERDDDSECEGSEQERRSQKPRRRSKRKEKKPREGDSEEGGGREAEVHIQAEINVEPGQGGPEEEEEEEEGEGQPARPKYRKEKKKAKERADTRTEEEKLWDDSILGC